MILISAFVLASASAQAGESRGLAVAATDQPQATTITQPEAAKADIKADTVQPEAA